MAAKTDVGAPDETAPAPVKLVEVRLLGSYVPADAIANPGGTFDAIQKGEVVSLPAPEAVRILKAGVAELTEDAYANLGK